MSHRDLVSIIPYSSVASAEEPDDKITARQDARRPRPSVATGNQRLSTPDRHEAINELVKCLDNWPSQPDSREQQLLLADDYGQSSPGRI